MQKVTALLGGVVLLMAGCSDAEQATPTPPPVPCEMVSNGTPTPKTPEAAPSGDGQNDLANEPEVGTGYRKDMTAVRTGRC